MTHTGSPAAEAERLDLVFAALSDPTRRAMLERLGRGPATVSELAAPLPITLPAVLKHLQVLGSADLVTRSKQGRTGHCTLDLAGVREAGGWLSDRETFWSATLDRLRVMLDASIDTTHASTEDPG